MTDCIFCQMRGYIGQIRKHTYWTVIVSREQHTLGTLIFFLNRHCLRFSAINKDELEELHKLQKTYEAVLDKHFSPDRYNYLQCGNYVEHLHIHLIPRYREPRKFMKKQFEDANFGDSVRESKIIGEESLLNAIRKLFVS